MAAPKERVTVTLDRALIKAANEAVAAGRASSFSAWVNAAMAEHAEKEQGLRAMAEAIAAYEAEFGVITPEELAARRREDRRTAIKVRPQKRAMRGQKTMRSQKTMRAQQTMRSQRGSAA